MKSLKRLATREAFAVLPMQIAARARFINAGRGQSAGVKAIFGDRKGLASFYSSPLPETALNVESMLRSANAREGRTSITDSEAGANE